MLDIIFFPKLSCIPPVKLCQTPVAVYSALTDRLWLVLASCMVGVCPSVHTSALVSFLLPIDFHAPS